MAPGTGSEPGPAPDVPSVARQHVPWPALTAREATTAQAVPQ